MKKYLVFMLIFSLALGLCACGSSAAAEEPAASMESGTEEIAAEAVDEVQSETADSAMTGEMTTIDMLYYLQLGEGSIMAACYTEEGIAQMGSDYYVVHVGDAEIYNAAGETVTLDDLTRGCPISIEWPGMVMESYPAQISAMKVTALSDEADPSVPAEDEIPAVGGGVKWWEPELQTEIPSITMEYITPDFATAVFLDAHGTGSWAYTEDGTVWNEVNVDGDHPLDWAYDDNNTCKRVNYDTVTFTCGVQWSEISVEAYVDGSEEVVEVPVAEDGSIALVDGDEVIYVIHCAWEAEDYYGNGEYAVKIVVPTES